MKNKIQLIILSFTLLACGYLIGSYYPNNKNLVELQNTKQGLFLIHENNLYTVSKLVTDTDSYQEMKRIK